MKVPCYCCEYRKVGCHDYCRSYKEYKKKMSAKNLRDQEYLMYLTGVGGAYNRMRMKKGVMRV